MPISGRAAIFKQFELYSYGPAELASGATFVPPIGTIVHVAYIDFACTQTTHFTLGLGGSVYLASSFDQNFANIKRSICVVVACDGVLGYRQQSGAGNDITIKGISMS